MITPYKFIQQDTSIDLLREICTALEVISNQLTESKVKLRNKPWWKLRRQNKKRQKLTF